MNFVHYIPSPSSTIKSLLLSKSAYFMSFYCDPLHLIGVSYMHVGEGYLLHQEQRISNHGEAWSTHVSSASFSEQAPLQLSFRS